MDKAPRMKAQAASPEPEPRPAGRRSMARFLLLAATMWAALTLSPAPASPRQAPLSSSPPGGTAAVHPGVGSAGGDRTWILLAGHLKPAEAEQSLSMRLQGLTVAEALRYLFDGTDVHLIADESLSERSWGELESMAVAPAFERILNRHDLSWRAEGATVLVERREFRTFRLNYVQEENSLFWDELEPGLRGLLSPEGELVVHRRSGILAATDRPGSLRRLESFIDALQDDMSRQVNLEANIIEVTLDRESELGVDWSAAAYGLDNYAGNTSSGQLVELSTVRGTGVFQMGLIRTDRMQALLDFLHLQGDVRVVSRPRVAAMGNEKAVFRATENIPYYALDVFSSTGSDPYTQYSIEFKEAGVVMEVLAKVGQDGSVVMRVHPSVSSLTGYTASLPNLPPQPIVDQRETETTVRIRQGETLVIGGLIQERERFESAGIPVLSRIPLLGHLFRNTRTGKSRQELVVSVTPAVVEDGFISAIRELQSAVLTPVAWSRRGTAADLAVWEHNRALDAYLAGDPAGARRRAERAVALAPSEPALRLNLAVYRAANGDLTGARRDLYALESDPRARQWAEVNRTALSLLQAEGLSHSSRIATETELDPQARTVAALNESSRLERRGLREDARVVLQDARLRLPPGATEMRRILEGRESMLRVWHEPDGSGP